MSVGVSMGVSVGVSMDASVGVSVGVSMGVSVGGSMDASVGVSMDAYVGVSVGVSMDASVGVSVGVSGCVSGVGRVTAIILWLSTEAHLLSLSLSHTPHTCRHVLTPPKRAQAVHKLFCILRHRPPYHLPHSLSSLDLLPHSMASAIRKTGSLG